MIVYAQRLRDLVREAADGLRSIPHDESSVKPGPTQWSPKEIVGHLIDSASNNHQRFVRSQFQDEMVFPGYDQDAWVSAQRYQDAEWTGLIELWTSFNNHIAYVMEAIPEDIRLRPRRVHNLHELAWDTVPETASTTLDYFMEDYVRHLEHHLRQIFGDSFGG